jgi:hypothetical protein
VTDTALAAGRRETARVPALGTVERYLSVWVALCIVGPFPTVLSRAAIRAELPITVGS